MTHFFGSKLGPGTYTSRRRAWTESPPPGIRRYGQLMSVPSVSTQSFSPVDPSASIGRVALETAAPRTAGGADHPSVRETKP